jgi:hypothetical protein
MLMRILLLLAALSILGAGAAAATSDHKSRHVRRHPVQAAVVPVEPAPYNGPTLVLHPAHNIACDTPYRSTRALPCDQPVWVYGRPCEVDRGLGRYQSCD